MRAAQCLLLVIMVSGTTIFEWAAHAKLFQICPGWPLRVQFSGYVAVGEWRMWTMELCSNSEHAHPIASLLIPMSICTVNFAFGSRYTSSEFCLRLCVVRPSTIPGAELFPLTRQNPSNALHRMTSRQNKFIQGDSFFSYPFFSYSFVSTRGLSATRLCS